MALTVIGDALPDWVRVVPPLLDVQVAVYDVIALPLSPGALNATKNAPFPRVTVGASGRSPTATESTPSVTSVPS